MVFKNNPNEGGSNDGQHDGTDSMSSIPELEPGDDNNSSTHNQDIDFQDDGGKCNPNEQDFLKAHWTRAGNNENRVAGATAAEESNDNVAVFYTPTIVYIDQTPTDNMTHMQLGIVTFALNQLKKIEQQQKDKKKTEQQRTV